MNRIANPEPVFLYPVFRPLVTISVVSHGHGVDVIRLLDSLRAHEQVDQLQIIVTDNLNSDLPESLCTGWKSLQVLRNKRPQGFAQNHNIAYLLARGQYFCILNPDVIFIENTLQPLIRHLESGRWGIISPLAIDSKGELQDSFRRLPRIAELIERRWFGRKLACQVSSTQPVLSPDWIAGFFLLMQTSVFERLGGFDERYHLYFEDVDLCTRARLMGLSLAVDTSLFIQHEGRHSSEHKIRYLAWHVHSAIQFFTSETYKSARKEKT